MSAVKRLADKILLFDLFAGLGITFRNMWKKKETVATMYAKRLVAEGVVTEAEVQELKDEHRSRMDKAHFVRPLTFLPLVRAEEAPAPSQGLLDEEASKHVWRGP